MASKVNKHKPFPTKKGGKVGPGQNKQKKATKKGMHSKSVATNC